MLLLYDFSKAKSEYFLMLLIAPSLCLLFLLLPGTQTPQYCSGCLPPQQPNEFSHCPTVRSGCLTRTGDLLLRLNLFISTGRWYFNHHRSMALNSNNYLGDCIRHSHSWIWFLILHLWNVLKAIIPRNTFIIDIRDRIKLLCFCYISSLNFAQSTVTCCKTSLA